MAISRLTPDSVNGFDQFDLIKALALKLQEGETRALIRELAEALGPEQLQLPSDKPAAEDGFSIVQFGPRGIFLRFEPSGDEHIPGHLPVMLRAAHALQRAVRLASSEELALNALDEEESQAAQIGIELICGLAADAAARADALGVQP